jgi:hypothetical protein
VQQHAIAMPNAARRQRDRRRLDASGKLGPGPGLLAPDDRRPGRKTPGGLQQQMREVAGRDQCAFSRIET